MIKYETNNRGVVLVELLITLPIFLILIVTLLTLSMSFEYRANITEAARLGLRVLANSENIDMSNLADYEDYAFNIVHASLLSTNIDPDENTIQIVPFADAIVEDPISMQTKVVTYFGISIQKNNPVYSFINYLGLGNMITPCYALHTQVKIENFDPKDPSHIAAVVDRDSFYTNVNCSNTSNEI